MPPGRIARLPPGPLYFATPRNLPAFDRIIHYMLHRRAAMRALMGFAAGSPLWAQAQQAAQDDLVMGPVNVHEFEEVARKNMHKSC